MKIQVYLLLLAPCLHSAHAFVGFHIKMYKPICAYACRGAIGSAPLSCTETMHHMEGMGHMSDPTTPDCRAHDDSFLTTLAYCMKSKCASFDISTSALEGYWEKETTGDPATLPKWSYGDAIMNVKGTPRQEYKDGDTLNYTALVSEISWKSNKDTMEDFEWQETLHARFGLAILIVGAGIPILLKLISYLPYTTKLFDILRPYIVYPATFGRRHVQSLPYYLGNPPTMGQTTYIVIIVLLNIFFASLGYKSVQPSTFYASRWQELMAYICNRTGVLAFALAPLTLLFAGRNNFLIWITNWPHATFILLHRWVARLCALNTILHSIMYVLLYKNMGTYEDNLVQAYWIWGAVGTVAVSIMMLTSILWVRVKSYEIFLISHILLAIFFVVGCWYHVEYRFQRKWGYEIWIYIACAIWFFDRLVRVIRILKNGMKKAKVVEIGPNFARVDIEGVRWNEPGYHAYVYFPSLSVWRPWENHPFSIIPTALINNVHSSASSSEDVEKRNINTTVTSIGTAGVSLYIRKSTGLTTFLENHDSLLTLIDGPYRNHNHGEIMNCDRLVLIGGGIGVTALIPYTRSHTNAKLYWSLKSTAKDLYENLGRAVDAVENEVKLGQRFDPKEVLLGEMDQGWKKIGVIVCGPGGLCDDVRATVVELGRKRGTVFNLQIEAFSW